MSEESKDKDLSEAAQKLLITSIFSGGSYEYGSQYRDKVEKVSGERKLSRLTNTYLDETWPEILAYLNAFSLKEKESITYGNDVEIQLLDKSENLFLFKVLGGVGGCLLLINEEELEVQFFSDIEEVKLESIEEILKGLDKDEIEQEEEPEDWHGTNELIDDLIGDRDDLYELVDDEGNEALSMTEVQSMTIEEKEALLKARGVALESSFPRQVSKDGSRKLTFVAVVQDTGNIQIDNEYVEQLDLEPGDELVIKLEHKKITLIPVE